MAHQDFRYECSRQLMRKRWLYFVCVYVYKMYVYIHSKPKCINRNYNEFSWSVAKWVIKILHILNFYFSQIFWFIAKFLRFEEIRPFHVQTHRLRLFLQFSTICCLNWFHAGIEFNCEENNFNDKLKHKLINIFSELIFFFI